MNESAIPGMETIKTPGLDEGQASAPSTDPPPSPAAPGFNRLAALIPAISARILKAEPDKLDATIRTCLQEVMQQVALDRGALLRVSQDRCMVAVAFAWYADGVEVVSNEINLAAMLPWTYHQVVVLGRTIAKYGVDSMPVEAEADRRVFVEMGIRSALAIPLIIGHRVDHIIVAHSLRTPCTWPEHFIDALRLLGEIFVSALERRDMLRSLAVYQERLDVAASSAGAGLWEFDPTTGTIWTTGKARELFHLEAEEEIPFTDFLDRMHPEDRAMITGAVEEALREGTTLDVEYRINRPDGSIRWLMSKGRVRQDDRPTSRRLTGATLDITPRKQMEQKLVAHVREINQLRELLEQENILLKSEAGLDSERHRSLGHSRAMQGVKALIEQVARTDSTVLISGETGTGKELVAQAIHQLSPRHKRLMVTVNCAALPAPLIESELFGREKGAFTGALSRQIGRFELAHGSTLFLDEIAEMPLETQAKLLRVLQTGRFERLGSPHSVQVDVRILAATNRNLAEEVENGRFRRDLFYRLNIFPIEVPPLRDRAEDIPLLTWKFVHEFGQRMGRKISRIAQDDMERLTTYGWPGNVRELRNVIERAMITSPGPVLDLSAPHLATTGPRRPTALPSLEEAERRHILEALALTGGKIKGKGGAAELLGLHPSTLYSRMRKLALKYHPPAPKG